MKLAEDCHRCRLRETATQVVWGGGPLNARGVLVGEGPGKEEDKYGTAFYGKAGQELDAFLLGQKSPRQNHYVTNLVKCRPPGNRDPRPDEVEACSFWLRQELELLQERVVIGSIGLPSTRYFLGPQATMEYNHGIMYLTDRWGPVLPIYHPAAGLRDQAMMMNVISDLAEYVMAIRGQKKFGTVKDEYKGKEGYRIAAKKRVALPPSTLYAIDTEDDENGGAWSIQYTTMIGGGIVVLAENERVIQDLRDELANPRVLTILHNSLHDLPVLASLGIYPARVADTMVMAYLLQTEPQGLKPLAYRHAGMRMREYMDVVGPYTRAKALDYLKRALKREWPDPEPVLEWKKGQPHVRQPQNMTRRLTAMMNKVDAGGDPWELWHNMKDRDAVEDAMGPMRPAFLSDVPLNEAVEYAGRDPDATLRVYNALWPRIQALGLEETFWTDMGAIRLVLDMMKWGMPIDPPKFKELSHEFRKKQDRLEMDIRSLVGRDFNVGSSAQVSGILFEHLKLKPIKRGKLYPSADDSVLARLVDDHPVVQRIRDWRTYDKLRTSYANVIPTKAKNGRVHSTFRVTRTATGRLSSSDPNLQAQPVRTAEGRMIRDCYIAEEGFTFVSADYSQIEMRVTAHCSKDAEMCKIFRIGADIHTRTAMGMFDIPESAVDSREHRYPAKRIGFGVLTDIQAPGLQREMLKEGAPSKIWGGKAGLARCGALIKRWHEIYEGVARWKEKHKALARRYLYVRDEIQGRIRFVPGVRSPGKWVRLDAEHAAVSGPIQMGAQAIIKRAMGELVPICPQFGARPLLQIHDDLVFECPEEEVEGFVTMLRAIMERAASLSIPVHVDIKVGERWGSMKTMKY